MVNLREHFAITVEKCPNRIAIVDGKADETNFAQLRNRVTELASAWQSKDI